MAEAKMSEKETATTVTSTAVADGEQETGVLDPVELATPMDESKTMNETKKETPSRPRSRVRFQEDEEPAPPKPPRPLSPQTQAENTLIEAFPTIDVKVVRAVLKASGGNVEPAFNALLGMSDPDFNEEVPPPQPPRPNAEQRQLQQDEMYARQLAEHYHARSDHRRGPRPVGNQPRANPQPNSQQKGPPGQEDREYSFFDDELPEIRENLRQGFVATQSKVNKWISDFRKRIDGEDEGDDPTNLPVAGQGPPRQNFGTSQTEQLRGIRKMSSGVDKSARRSTDLDRYDADPRVLSGDFADLDLKPEDTPPRKPSRRLANPDLFKPTPAVPPQSGPVDEVDALTRAPLTSTNPNPTTSPGKSKKWQPLTSVAPAPETDDNDDDPFSLGDEEDEADKKEREEEKKRDVNEEATERLKKAASVSGYAGKGKGRAVEELEEHERSGSQGTRNKEAEDILNG